MTNLHKYTCIKQVGFTDIFSAADLFSILDGDGTVESGAFASYSRATSKTTEPTKNGESAHAMVTVVTVGGRKQCESVTIRS